MSGLKVLVIIIWILRGAASGTWEIKMPEKIDAMSGFCVQIPCQFEIPNSFKKSLNKSVEAIWKKTTKEGPDVLSSIRTGLSLLKGNVIGNILNKNCTTVFHNFPVGFSDKFFFRLQGPEPLLYTFEQGVNITVHEDVLPPILSTFVEVLEVLEGTRLTLTCSTVISCPSIQPLMQWNPQLGEQLTPALQMDEFGQTLLVSSQTFNATPLHDRLKVSCSLFYSQDTKRSSETSVTLRVLYAPKNTIALVSPSGPPSEGSVVTLSCHSDANPVAVDINRCSIAPYIICGLLTLFLIVITAVDLVKYKSLLKRLQASESLHGPMTYATLHRTSDSVYNVIPSRASRSEDNYENRNFGKPQPK